MQQPFDPYQQWLGIAGPQPTNFYELLGLQLFEDDVQTIAQAIEARATQLRGVRPGPQVEEWRKMLDQLNSAKTTLLNATAKSHYDAMLRNGAPQALMGWGNEANAVVTDRQQGASSTPGAAMASVPPSPIPCALPVAQPSQSAWRRVPMAIPLSQVGGVGLASGGQPVAAAIPVQPHTVNGPDEPYETPIGQRTAPSSEPRRPVARRSMAIGVPTILVALVTVAVALAYQVHKKRQETALRGQISLGPAGSWQRYPTDGGAARSGVGGNGQKTLSLAQRTPGSHPSAQGATGQAGNRSESVNNRTATPPGSEKATVGPSPAGSAAGGTSQESPAFIAAAQKVFSAMSTHDGEQARRELKSAVALAKTEAEKADTARLDLMIGYLDEFWNGISRVVAGLEGGEVFVFNDEPIVVVEGTSETLMLRGRGQNREYAIRSIPALMVMRLADKRFRSAESKALYGVYLAVDPKGDPARAKQLWEEAARAGINVQPLLEMDLTRFGRAGETPSGTGSSPETLEKKITALEEAEKAAHGLQDYKKIAEESLALWEQAMKANRPEEAKRLAEIALSAAQEARSIALMKAARSAGEQTERMGQQE